MENHEQKPTPEPRKNVSMDGVLNELRSVLSGLGDSVPSTPADPIETSPPPPPPPILKMPPTPPSESPVVKRSEPAPPPINGDSSDADFWNGNVLGWPSSVPEAAPPPPPPPIKPAPVAYEKPALEGEPFSLDTPFLKSHDMSEPAVAPPPPPSHEPAFEPNPWGVSPVIPEPPSPPTALHPLELPNEEPLIDPFAVIPPEGMPSLAKPMAPEPVPIPKPFPDVTSEAPMQFESALPTVETPKMPNESSFPIPGTLTNPVKPAEKENADDPLNLKGDEMKPSGLIQIACLFPEGQERQSQQFVNKLRDLGEKSKVRVKIEPVFVSSWGEGQADIAAWSKSATLSGADIMFVLAFKKDIAQFKLGRPGSSEKSVRTRLIAVEHLGLRTLYADILIELERGK